MTTIVETRITYHRGAIDGAGTVLDVIAYPSNGDERCAIITDSTPFHPIDLTWPDQPGDHGVIELDSTVLPVVDTQIAAMLRNTDEVRIGPAVSARHGIGEFVFAVAHIIDGDPADTRSLVGRTVRLRVDRDRRLALSAAHTGCHLVAYAFNQATDGLWTKRARLDARGNRDFDNAALLETRHFVGGSVDRYRLGKSLRKKGFDHPALISDLDAYVAEANRTLAAWVAERAGVTVSAESDLFTAERVWRCELADTPAFMPCGGTHVEHLGEIASIDIHADFSEDKKELVLRASTKPA